MCVFILLDLTTEFNLIDRKLSSKERKRETQKSCDIKVSEKGGRPHPPPLPLSPTLTEKKENKDHDGVF